MGLVVRGINNSLKTIVLMATLQLSGCMSADPLAAHRGFLREHIYNNPDIVAHDLRSADFSLHYRSRGEAKKAILVWIHGTPGSWSDIGRLFAHEKFLSEVKLVAVDRPGWGDSQYTAKARLVPDFAEISRLLEPLFNQLRQQYKKVPIIVGGHSWGGSVAPTIALNNRNSVSGLLIVAASLDPELAGPRWYNRLARNSLVARIIGRKLSAANSEIYALPRQLLEQTERLSELTLPAIVMQGESDSLVDPRNADFAERMFNSSTTEIVLLPDQGHLLQIERADLVARCVLAFVTTERKGCVTPDLEK